MNTLTFKARIDGLHFDPKKGVLKIQLTAVTHVSLDKITTLGPSDEVIQFTLESEQTKIDVLPLGATEPKDTEEEEEEEEEEVGGDQGGIV